MSAASTSRLRVRVPAKINLFLAVRGVRDDGFHELVTVFQSIALYDTLTLTLQGQLERLHHPAGAKHTTIDLVHDAGAAVPDDERNLVVAAADLLARHQGVGLTVRRQDLGPEGLHTLVELSKRIPVAGGMAGGSADAAAALIGLTDLWALNLERASLRELAAALGSDVPFTVVGGTALATGTGTGFAQVLCRGTFHWVVCIADRELSTHAVYAAWDQHCRPNEIQPDAVLAAVTTGDTEALGAALHNDLQPAAETLAPRLAADRKALLDAGALGAIVSGSGPTLLGLAADAEQAQRIAAAVAERFDQVLVSSSPAGGPAVDRHA